MAPARAWLVAGCELRVAPLATCNSQLATSSDSPVPNQARWRSRHGFSASETKRLRRNSRVTFFVDDGTRCTILRSAARANDGSLSYAGATLCPRYVG